MRIPKGLLTLFRLTSATAISQTLGILASPVLTRLYSPDDFGVLTLFLSLISLGTTVSAFRYEAAVPLPEDSKDAVAVLVLSVLLTCGISVVFAFVLWALGQAESKVELLSPVLPYWWLVGLTIAGYGIYNVFSQWLLRERQYAILARTKLQQGFGLVFTQLSLGFLGSGALGLLLGQLVGSVAGIGVMIRSFLCTARPLVRRVRVRDVADMAWRFRRFPVLSAPSAFLNSLGLALPSLFLAARYDTSVTGWYGLTVRIAGLPMTVVGRSIASIYHGELARLVRSKPDELHGFFYRTLSRMAFLGFVLVLVPLVLGSFLIPWVFGPAWAQSGRYLQILAPMYAAQFVASVFGSTLEVLERQDLYLLRELCRTSIVALALYIGTLTGQPPEWAIGILSLAGVIGYALYLYLAVLAVNDHKRRIAGQR